MSAFMASSSSVKAKLVTVSQSAVQKTEGTAGVNKETAVTVGNPAGQIISADNTASSQNLKTNTDRYAGDDVDKSAEEFIAKFRQNLEMERLRSLERYQEMLRRGL